MTELMLDNKFQTRSTPEIAAMLSAMTCQYKERNGDILKNNSEFTPPAVLQQVYIPLCTCFQVTSAYGKGDD